VGELRRECHSTRDTHFTTLTRQKRTDLFALRVWLSDYCYKTFHIYTPSEGGPPPHPHCLPVPLETKGWGGPPSPVSCRRGDHPPVSTRQPPTRHRVVCSTGSTRTAGQPTGSSETCGPSPGRDRHGRPFAGSTRSDPLPTGSSGTRPETDGSTRSGPTANGSSRSPSRTDCSTRSAPSAVGSSRTGLSAVGSTRTPRLPVGSS